MIRHVFLDLISMIQGGRARDVLRLLLNGYHDLHIARPTPVVLTDVVTEAEGMEYINAFLASNAASRFQLVVWSAAYENDPGIWKLGEINGNDKHDRVADIRGDNYAIECKLGHVKLGEAQNTANKARAAGCKSVLFVSGQSAAFRDDEGETIVETISKQYPDIAMKFLSLREYLDAVLSLGKVSWISLLNRITQVVSENSQPHESSVWASIASRGNVKISVDHGLATGYETASEGDDVPVAGTASPGIIEMSDSDFDTLSEPTPEGKRARRKIPSIVSGAKASLVRAVRGVPVAFANLEVLFDMIDRAETGIPVSKRQIADVSSQYSDLLREITRLTEINGHKDDVIQAHSSLVAAKDQSHEFEKELLRLEHPKKTA